MKELTLQERLKTIEPYTIEENYYMGQTMVDLGYGDSSRRLKENVGYVIYHGEVSMYYLGKIYIDGYDLRLEEYFDNKNTIRFHEYCDHKSISQNLTIDSSDEEFFKYIDYEKCGEDMMREGEGYFGGKFHAIDGHILETLDFDWIEDEDDDEYSHDVVVACYEAVKKLIDTGLNINDAIRMVYENYNEEVA